MSGGSIRINPGAPEEVSLEFESGEIVSIGRKSDPEAQKMLLLSFPTVSERHAKIHCKANGWTIVDVGSTNGTSINGVRLAPGREYKLETNDLVNIAEYELIVSMEIESAERPSYSGNDCEYRMVALKPDKKD